MKRELRYFKTPVEIRSDDDGNQYAEGYAARFNELSSPLGFGRHTFRERIAPDAFDEVLRTAQDVVALFNHNYDLPLGRVSNNELRLHADKNGLRYSVRLSQATYAQDLAICLARRDVQASSFGFTVADGGDSWERAADGSKIRTVHNIERVYDVSPVTLPAYPTATAEVAIRSLELFETEQLRLETSKRKAAERARWLTLEG